MGSITKKPKIPTIKYVTPTVSSTSSASNTSSATTPDTTLTEKAPTLSDAEISTAARTQSLLRRSRGRIGTVVTGFRGLLSGVFDTNDSDSNKKRKTLLGE